jgi:hypothetical protein
MGFFDAASLHQREFVSGLAFAAPLDAERAFVVQITSGDKPL